MSRSHNQRQIDKAPSEEEELRTVVLPPDPNHPSFKKIRSRIESWKKHLLDLSQRNRLINYKSRTTSIVLDATNSHSILETLKKSPVNLEKLINISGLDEQQIKDRRGQRALFARSLDNDARTMIREQGVSSLHVAAGWVRYPNPQHESQANNPGNPSRRRRRSDRRETPEHCFAPLLLIPVSLRIERSKGTITVLQDLSQLVQANPVLTNLLELDYRLKPKLDPEIETYEHVVEAFKKVISALDGWVLEDRAPVLDTFWFANISLYQDLITNENAIHGHSLVQALAGVEDQDLPMDWQPAFEEPSNLDHAVQSGHIQTVLPTDSSQLLAILQASKGQNMVIQGPPGTGKSTTITNLIGHLLSLHKTVLFVTEKTIAREVVYDELKKAGLTDACIHISTQHTSRTGTANRNDRNVFLEECNRQLQAPAEAHDVPHSVKASTNTARRRLVAYRDALHAAAGKDGWTTPFQLLGHSVTCEKELVCQSIDAPMLSTVDQATWGSIQTVAERLETLGDETSTSALGHWSSLSARNWSYEFQNRLDDQITQTLKALELIASYIEDAKAITGPEPTTDAMSTSTSAGTGSSEPPLGLSITELRVAAKHLSLICKWSFTDDRTSRFLDPRWWLRKSNIRKYERLGFSLTKRDPKHDTAIAEALGTLDKAEHSLNKSFADPVVLETTPLIQTYRLCHKLQTDMPNLQSIIEWKVQWDLAVSHNVDDHLNTLIHRSGTNRLVERLCATYWHGWADQTFNLERPALKILATEHDAAVKRFTSGENTLREEATKRIMKAVTLGRESGQNSARNRNAENTLKRQIRNKRKRPLRWIFKECAPAITALKPCTLMSPLAVSQYLEASQYHFDVVIFDEASQIPTARAISAIIRADQTVIVGDSQQMPPSNYGQRSFSWDDSSFSAEEEDLEIFESILDEGEAFLPQRMLTRHYRSKHESLIAFSNAYFYNNELLTVQSPFTNDQAYGVHFEYVENGLYDRSHSRTNRPEAERVVDLLIDELSEHPNDEVGITTMSQAQQRMVETIISERLSESEALASWYDGGGRPNNLETIQGDEYDAMIISIGYGPDETGVFHLNFGPVNNTGGERRLNVLVTRARRKTIVVASIHGEDIDISRANSEGARVLRSYLSYAEKGPTVIAERLRSSGSMLTYDSVLEEEIGDALRNKGIPIETQIGVSNYRIDIGLKHPTVEGRYVLAVECDGATYHSSRTARDRDIIRQGVLENLGWNFHRIWSTDWFNSPEKELAKVVKKYNELL